MNLMHTPNFEILKDSTNCENQIRLNQIFQALIIDLKKALNLDLVNKQFKLHLIDNIKSIDLDSTLFDRGLNTYIKKDVYHIKLFKYYQHFFPFFLLKSAYKMFIIDELKQSKIIDFAINQIIDFDLGDYNAINDWRGFIQEKSDYYEFFPEQSKTKDFIRYLQIKVRKTSESPKIFFFKFTRRHPDVILTDDLSIFNQFLIQEFKYHSSKQLLSDELTETIRVLVEIFYKIENCDNLKEYYKHFKILKEQKSLQTDLTFRSFRKNLRWLDRFSYIAPTYYIDWKTLDQAVLVCHLAFNPLLEKRQIDKIIKKMPFLVMPKLSISNFAIDFSGYFVLPKKYIKDLIYFLDAMEQDGYIIYKELSQAKSYCLAINLNYFKESFQVEEIVYPNSRNYTKKYEIIFKMEFSKEFKNSKLSILDYLILEEIRFIYFRGISRIELLKQIKSDFSDFFSDEYKKIEELENLYKITQYYPNLIIEFLNYLQENQKKDFFNISDELELLLKYFNIIEESNKIANINTFNHLIEALEKKNIIQTIDENEIVEKKDLIRNFDAIFQNYFMDKENFKKKVENHRYFHKILKLCSSLKIFNINSIKRIFSDPSLLKEISEIKKTRLNDLKKNFNQNIISNKYIHQRINYFLNSSPRIVKPYLLDSIFLNWSYFPEIVLKNTSDVKSKLLKIMKYFPKVYFYETKDFSNNQDYIFAQFHLSNLLNQEKLILLSLLHKNFKDNIVSFKRYTWNGFLPTYLTRDFYVFNDKNFYYTNDLFDQYFLYSKAILGKELMKFNKEIKLNHMLWHENKSIEDLVEKVNKRVRIEKSNFQSQDLPKLIDFYINIEKYLINKEKYRKVRKEEFFKYFIKSIKIIPAFHSFGLSQYQLYLTPFDFDEIDFRLLFTNSFQKIKLKSSFGRSNSILINYIFPYADPNNSYLNWLRGQKKIQEYCLFKVESLSQIFHFDRNLSTFGWDLDFNSFKEYIQDLLKEPKSYDQDVNIKTFNFGNSNITDYRSPNSEYFKLLLNLYNWHSTDVKKKLQFLNSSSFEELRLLIENKVIYPYLKLKNLEFKEIIHFFLINIKEDTIDILKKAFQYFNLVNFYEIKGEYYIHGFDSKKEIKKGLLVKLFLPDCRIADFLRVFEYVFQFLNVEKYLILNDLVNGEHFVKSVFGDNKIFETYNPLNNLIWDPKKKIWKNHKLFGPKFEYLYPDLNYNQNEDMSSALK